MQAGYSGTPLAKKLGLKPGLTVCAIGAPRAYREIVTPWPDGIELQAKALASTELVHLFVDSRAHLAAEAKRLRALAGASATPSINVFQALQCGHLPCHLGVLPPHSLQL